MSLMPTRPKRGLDPESAFKKWTDEARLTQLARLSGKAEPPSDVAVHRVIGDPVTLREYQKLREAADQAFKELLSNADIIGSGIPEGGSGRIPIEPSLWDILEIDYEFFEAVGEHHKFEKLEFFELSIVPLNIRTIPKWLDDALGQLGYNKFRHAPDYRHIWLHGISYDLSPQWANIVRVLHEAWLDDSSGWRNGKKILELAGSSQLKLSDVLKTREDGRSIVQSDGKGMYRLAIDPPREPPPSLPPVNETRMR
ncbi:hypothetical protein XH99_16700 [Bradyrhizobium nanningense]|uniref:Uncharacterized protein n=1 Tax=Bradyrhizobium nanningense TaxID=1325118 RepID=A0A4Q0S4R0_9BRAD|nr:hypothetical protein [Bradyrhizobium nanningense]RXH23036.1 hypothetical protein XH84_34080 [Bradyrhizobium nanningense]RXH27076.1 hypothetical protein XH99_16700 [Bradyrhizobium nanningense]